MNAVLFFVCFILLFLLSRELTATLSFVFFQTTRNSVFAIRLLALLFLPGVIIHELSHWFVASILFVPTGEIEFFPQAHGNSVKLGSVQIAQTDPARRFFIGIAPVLGGMFVLFALFWFLQPTIIPITWKSIVFFYSLFEIGNTMFSSKKDLEGVIGFLLFLFLAGVLLFFLHIPVEAFLLSMLNQPYVQVLFSQITLFLLIAIVLDLVTIGFLRGGIRLFGLIAQRN